MFNRKGETSEFQLVIQFLKDKYNRLVEIRSLKGNNYINELTICSYIKKCIKFSKSMKIERVSSGYFLNLESERDAALMFAKCYERCAVSGYWMRQDCAERALKYFTE